MNILELCTSLTSGQVLKIVKSYTPDDCENAIEPVFIEKLDVELNKRASKVIRHLSTTTKITKIIETHSRVILICIDFNRLHNGAEFRSSTQSCLQI